MIRCISDVHLIIQALSRVGRCQTYASSGDGYGRSEGFAVALLAPTNSCSRHALGIVRSSSVNQDGRSGALTAPNGPSQSRLVQNSLERGVANVVDLRHVAVHGTGTPLGDPIEIGALAQSLHGSFTGNHHVILASVKSCFGHAEGAAGLIGLTMTLKIQQSHAVPPIMHLQNINRYVDDALSDWQRNNHDTAGLPRQLQQAAIHKAFVAGTSSFGMSGVNAFVLTQPIMDCTQLQGSCQSQLQRSKIWPTSTTAHALLGCCISSQPKILFSCHLTEPSLNYLKDHVMQGSSRFPGSAICELVGASYSRMIGHSLDTFAASSVILVSYVAFNDSSELSCFLHCSSGALQMALDGQHIAHASLQTLASTGNIPKNAAIGSPSSECFSKMLTAARELHTLSPQTVATIAPQLQLGGYYCHPSLVQAGITLQSLTLPHMFMGCDGFMIRQTASNLPAAPNIATGLNALQGHCHEITFLAMFGIHSSTAAQLNYQNVQTPASWQIVAQPQRPKMNKQSAVHAIVIATQPDVFAGLVPDPSNSQALHERKSLYVLFCQSEGADSGCQSVVQSNATLCGDVCVSHKHHLGALLGRAKRQQLVFVQQADHTTDKDVAGALSLYSLVALLSVQQRLSLVTWQPQEGPKNPGALPTTAVLQGKMLGVATCCLNILKAVCVH